MEVQIYFILECDIRLNECNGINKHTNFNNVGASFITLFRMLTGDLNGVLRVSTIFLNN